MTINNIHLLKEVFAKFPEVKLIYFFGSQADGSAGPLSDYDFAVYLEPFDKKKLLEIKGGLLTGIAKILKTDNLDLVILNLAKSPELKYSIISKGKLIYEKKPLKIMVEPKILSEYFDFKLGLGRYGLTAA